MLITGTFRREYYPTRGSVSKMAHQIRTHRTRAAGNFLDNGLTGKRTTSIDIPTVQDYLDHLGQRIAAHVPDANFPFIFSAIAEDPCPAIHEPAALPGGYTFVPAASRRD